MRCVREYRKIKLIMNELLDYFYNSGMTQANIHFGLFDHQSEITITGQIDSEPSDLDFVIEKLRATQQPEVEEYYEDLLGLRDDEFHVDILSALIDVVEYDFEDNIMMLKAIRKHH